MIHLIELFKRQQDYVLILKIAASGISKKKLTTVLGILKIQILIVQFTHVPVLLETY